MCPPTGRIQTLLLQKQTTEADNFKELKLKRCPLQDISAGSMLEKVNVRPQIPTPFCNNSLRFLCDCLIVSVFFWDCYPTADILTSSDHLTNTVDDYQLERWPQAASAANIGRHKKATRQPQL
eukprot:scaffold158001_cov17-Tisochrysis_lutea.AAC.1